MSRKLVYLQNLTFIKIHNVVFSTGVTPKAFTQQKNKNTGSGCFFYGGNTYTTQR